VSFKQTFFHLISIYGHCTAIGRDRLGGNVIKTFLLEGGVQIQLADFGYHRVDMEEGTSLSSPISG
jgi:hypothetical protein